MKVAAEKLGWRKGPWTHEEDKLLSEYVSLHGEGRWSSVSKFTGLNRGGKSCRLRWVNYLRPGLKKGHLTPIEEGMIIELHALHGNKWSTIARYLPGRTDNEIKNYWRTHFGKRTQKAKNKKLEREKEKEVKQLKQKQEQQPQDPSHMIKSISSHVEEPQNETKPTETQDNNQQEIGFKYTTTMEQQCTSAPLIHQELSCMWPETTVDDGVWHSLWDFDEPQGFADHINQFGKCVMPNQATFGAGGDSIRNQDTASPFDYAYANFYLLEQKRIAQRNNSV